MGGRPKVINETREIAISNLSLEFLEMKIKASFQSIDCSFDENNRHPFMLCGDLWVINIERSTCDPHAYFSFVQQDH